MKNILLVVITLCLASMIGTSQATDCEVQEGLSLETALIYPLPFGVFTEEEGGLGINKEATIGEEYFYNWTMIWPDSFINTITNEIAYADTIQFFLDQTLWILEGDTVAMPEGLSWNITPEEGFALPSDEVPVLCIQLTGTPTENVTPGDYEMFFYASTCVNVPGVFDGCQLVYIPSVFSGFAGQYVLKINGDGTTSVKETLNSKVNLTVSPNPFQSNTLISFNAEELSTDYMFEVFDVNGRKVDSRSVSLKSGNTQIAFDGSDLDDGIYIYQISGEEGVITGKLILQQ